MLAVTDKKLPTRIQVIKVDEKSNPLAGVQLQILDSSGNIIIPTYVTFVEEHIDQKLTLLELGVGEMTPSIIKLPFWEMVHKNENCFLINVTLDRTTPPLHIKDRNLNIQMDAGHFLRSIVN